LFLVDRAAGKPEWTYNMLLKHGVRSCLEYARSFDLKRAHAVSNPQLSPHREVVDRGGHGYATVRLAGDEMRTEFVCIPRPITRSDRPDGGPLRYRVVHTASLWKPGERPLLRQQVIEGDPGLPIGDGSTAMIAPAAMLAVGTALAVRRGETEAARNPVKVALRPFSP